MSTPMRCVAAALAALLISVPGVAGDGMKIFPMWERAQCGEAELACYTFDQAKQIVTIDFDMQIKLAELSTCQKNYAALEEMQLRYVKVANIYTGIVDRTEERLRTHDEAMGALRVQLDSASSRDAFGGALPWIIVIVLAAAAAAFAGGFCAGSDAC